ncbi:hypothetical protein D6D01_09699 [Aureobasidium pullulans]|uniref:Uncharacterized protein n=1 Tax=Aureobasidium pullulans TaxID=5580 RepID=A0A4S9K0W4_AURPU|nr:hypothetical protein D6D01_09699 [Aureobasidium pullulans]
MSTSLQAHPPAHEQLPTKRKRSDDEESSTPKKKAPTKVPSTRKSRAASESESLYKDSIEAIEKGIQALDKRVKGLKWPGMNDCILALTIDNYAAAATEHLPNVFKLKGMDNGITLAFDLTMAIAEISYTDLEKTAKMSGWGDAEASYEELDGVLLSLIPSRKKPTTRLASLPEVPLRWTPDGFDPGPSESGRPGTLHQGWTYAQKMKREKDRREARRIRRETTQNWVSIALAELKEDRDYLDACGIEGYFPKSIAALEGILAEQSSPEAASPSGGSA